VKPRSGRWAGAAAIGAALLLGGAALPLQESARAAAERERVEFSNWLVTAPVSPRRAVAVLAIGEGLTLGGADAGVAIAGISPHRIEERAGRVSLTGPDGARPIRRGLPFTLGPNRLVVSGVPGRTTLTVFAPELRGGRDAQWFPYTAQWSFRVELRPPQRPVEQRLLAPDGVEVAATEAGTVTVTLGGATHSLRVMRLPGASDDESELEVYFRDSTNGRETYPSGRFVALVPEPGGRFRLDFNRARNPYCAYNTAYPCPAPWRGNLLNVAVPAGERYAGGGLDPSKP
jgi:hypothetical protein